MPDQVIQIGDREGRHERFCLGHRCHRLVRPVALDESCGKPQSRPAFARLAANRDSGCGFSSRNVADEEETNRTDGHEYADKGIARTEANGAVDIGQGLGRLP